MSEFIKVENDIITSHICGSPTESGLIKVPDWFAGFVGMSIKEFDNSWNILPLTQRIQKGLVEVPIGYVLEGEDFRPKTLAEQIDDGSVIVDEFHVFLDGEIREKTGKELIRDKLAPRPKGMKLVESSLEYDGLILDPMSIREQLDAGDMTKEEAEEAAALEVRSDRHVLFLKYDGMQNKLARELRLAQLSGDSTEYIEVERMLWDTYAQGLADIPEQSGFPMEVVWPIKPV